MFTCMRKRLPTLFVVSLFCYTVGSIVAFHDASATDSTALKQHIAAVANRPAEVAKLTHEAVSTNAKHAARTVRVAAEEAPPLAVVVTAAAVHAAPHRAADIVQAVATVTSIQTKKVQLSADIAATLTANPAESSAIIGAEVVAQPERAATIVTAAVTVCSVLEACAQSTIEDLVQAAVSADRNASETIVGAAVRLMPAKSGAIIAAAAAAMAPATVTPVRSAAYSEPTSQPSSQPAQAAAAPVPDLTTTDPVQRARVVPAWADQPNTDEARTGQPIRQTQSVQEDRDTLRELMRVETQPRRLVEEPEPPRRPNRPRPNPASPYQP